MFLSIFIQMFGEDVECEIVDVQKQRNMYDCGLFSIAFMVAFALSKDPARIVFDAQNLRKHLVYCLLTQNMVMLPISKWKTPKDPIREVMSSKCRPTKKPERYIHD